MRRRRERIRGLREDPGVGGGSGGSGWSDARNIDVMPAQYKLFHTFLLRRYVGGVSQHTAHMARCKECSYTTTVVFPSLFQADH